MHLPAQVNPGERRLALQEALVARDPGHERLAQRVDHRARERLERGHSPVEPAQARPDGVVEVRDYPGRRALEEVPVGHPRRAEQLAVEARVPEDVEAPGAAAQVVQDLVAHGIRAVPVVPRERERIEIRRDVALAARVAVRPPGAADVRAAFEHDEILDALLLEADRHPEAAEAGADDRHLVHPRAVHARNAIRAVSWGAWVPRTSRSCGGCSSCTRALAWRQRWRCWTSSW